jgi:broad specificity phosphatase PhoE
VATKIMFIRHGEKPDDNGSVRAVDENGAHDPNELTVRGWQRAGALVRFFAPPNGKFSHPALATPTTLFAAAAHGHTKIVRS